MQAAHAESADQAAVSQAYGPWAPAYIDLFGSADRAGSEDQRVIADWSSGLSGRVLDAGCGPGHWAAYLHARGVEVEGLDATPEFIAHAERAHPGVRFRLADLRTVELAGDSLEGVLAWFSLIHLDPHAVPGVLRRFARALRPGGRLLVGFFSGDDLEPFDHRVITGWKWPMAEMTAAIEAVGLAVVDTHEWLAPNGRCNAAVSARRAG